MAEVTIKNKRGETRQIDETAIPFFPDWKVVRDQPSSAAPAPTSDKKKDLTNG
jgi:hypothetical protein